VTTPDPAFLPRACPGRLRVCAALCATLACATSQAGAEKPEDDLTQLGLEQLMNLDV
jgi:hypothetical protein